jgi:hypothetical protein
MKYINVYLKKRDQEMQKAKTNKKEMHKCIAFLKKEYFQHEITS